ncbi:MAG: VOC family protein [Actinomycetaceae bacterium]
MPLETSSDSLVTSADHAVRARTIDHVAIASPDAERTARWYEENFGFVRVNDEIADDPGVRLVFLAAAGDRSNGTSLQIVQPMRPGPVADFLAQRGEGLHHVCFAVDDIASTLLARGQDSREVFTGGYGLPCAFVTDPSPGVVIELVQSPAGSTAPTEETR